MNNIFEIVTNQGGWTVAIVGYSIVFIALVCLIVFFSMIPKILNLRLKFELRRKGKEVSNDLSEFEVAGDVNAAISMALYMYFNEMHDEESNVITINRIKKRYSPWSSKIYNIYNRPAK